MAVPGRFAHRHVVSLLLSEEPHTVRDTRACTHVCLTFFHVFVLHPAVQRNREGLGAVIKQLQAQLDTQRKALAAFQQQYKIRIAQPGEDSGDEDEAPKKQGKSAASKDGKAGAGVLV